MRLLLQTWSLKSLSIKEKESPLKGNKRFKLSHESLYIEDDPKKFLIRFDVELDDEKFDINFKMDYLFDCDVAISDDFMSSDFVKVNAPAIAFPYLRAFISTLTLQSGLEPIILPSINFVELNKRNGRDENK